MLYIIVSFLFLFSLPVVSVFAQTNELNNSSDNHTAREEQEGKKIWEQLQARETSCDKLSDDNFQALGEYYLLHAFTKKAQKTPTKELKVALDRARKLV